MRAELDSESTLIIRAESDDEVKALNIWAKAFRDQREEEMLFKHVPFSAILIVEADGAVYL